MRLNEWHEERLRTDPSYAKAVQEVSLAQAIADAIVGARVRVGWTQRELAKRGKLTQPQVSQLESGVGNQQIDTVERAFAALAIDPAIVFGMVHAAETLPSESLVEFVGVTLAASTTGRIVEQVAMDVHPVADPEEDSIWDTIVQTDWGLAANSNLAMAA